MKHLGQCIRTRKYQGGINDPLIGLLVIAEEPNADRHWEKEMKYSVAWVDGYAGNPTGRDAWNKYFYRKDLKMVKKAR